MTMASSLLRQLIRNRALLPSSSSSTRRLTHSRPVLSPSSLPSHHYHFLSSCQPLHQTHRTRNVKHFSSLAQEFDDDDDGDNDGKSGNGAGGRGRDFGSEAILPTRHSRNLPPPVCPPARLRSEVEAIFDAPIGSLIVYPNSARGKGGQLKSAEEEMSDAYYASDAAVQRAEYIMRGLNANISRHSHVARCLERGAMALEGEGADAAEGSNGEGMAEEDCFRAMIDLIQRMENEGESYAELRRRVRSQLIDPTSAGNPESSSGKDNSSSRDDDSDSDCEGEAMTATADNDNGREFSELAGSMQQRLDEAKINNPRNAGQMDGFSTEDDSGEETGEDDKQPVSEELYQFGANPGVTTHMFDLLLDSLACLVDPDTSSSVSTVNLVDLMPQEHVSPPEFAKDILDHVLERHWEDGGDIGFGGGGIESNPFMKIGEGIGVGAGTGAGALANVTLFSADVRTCPTPMTFNAVLRIAANFHPASYVDAVEKARVLGGDLGNKTSSEVDASDSDYSKEEETQRLRDIAVDAALSTFSLMQDCAALTLQTLQKTTKKATSRSALKRQAKLLAGNYKGKANNNKISGRNSATYSYVIKTLANCIPPSLSRGNMTFGLYHKGCVQEGVMDKRLVNTMRAVGGYSDDGNVLGDSGGDEDVDITPPVSNGPLFDDFMAKELGSGVAAALEKGRKLRQDRNYRLRRHVEWDDTY